MSDCPTCPKCTGSRCLSDGRERPRDGWLRCLCCGHEWQATAAELEQAIASDQAWARRVAPRDDRRCGWCGELLVDTRSDARFCRKRCRQSSWRFGRGCIRAAAAAEPKRMAYADPPYPGKSGYYADHPDYAGEVDHVELVSRLQTYDGWALSTDRDSFKRVYALCPDDALVGSWTRGERPGVSYTALSAWEPVIYRVGRAYLSPVDERRVDALVLHSRPRLSDPERVIGAKPARFAWWMFGLIGLRPGDAFDDLFPGSGGIGRAWALYDRGGELSSAGGGDVSR